ncbi:MAG TPA: response regulator transcription factor [Mycobacteriales bacterium]|nr:response regulator transcription factor [Mycobacteriales bacterium]
MDGGLDAAREAHRRQAWADAFARFSAVDEVEPLAAADLELAAEAADLAGRSDDAVRLLRRAQLANADAGAVGPALRCAYWLGKTLSWGGEFAQAGAWLARARRLAEAHPDCPERAYLQLYETEQLFRAGPSAELLAAARALAAAAVPGGDADLAAAALMMSGGALISAGRVDAGLAQLDEAMVAVAGGDLSARATGMVYCVVIGICQDLHELHRAREWSDALAEWCAAQPEFTGAYRGLCRVHRVVLLRLSGGWPTALSEARLACAQLTGGYGEVVAGAAFYQLAELHRLRGESAEAEVAYRDALRYGGDIQPGMALLWLAQGRTDPAAAAIRRALVEAADLAQRAPLLPAAAEVLAAAGDLTGAAQAAAELAAVAEDVGTAALVAMSGQATGTVRLAEGAAEKALPALRAACRQWHELDVPYEAARTRVLIARACRTLGDHESAELELETARRVFAELGAATDLSTVDGLRGAGVDTAGLSPRELEVVRLVAAGRSNQAIAAELVLSEKTVARHLSNIFGKLGVTSRTAAAAYAYEHGLV